METEVKVIKNELAASFVRELNLDLQEIKKNFFKIGFRLDEAKRLEYYRDLGYETIEDCAEATFGFKKSTTYNLINVYRSFNENGTYFLPERWSSYSQSQLVEMAYSPVLKNTVQPSTTIAEIKEYKRLARETGNQFYYNSSFESLSDYIDYFEGNKPKEEPKKEEVLPVEEKTDNKTEFFQTSGKTEEVSFGSSDLFSGYGRNFLKNHKCAFKHQLVDWIYDKLESYNYGITLNGRKQSLKVTLGVITDLILTELIK